MPQRFVAFGIALRAIASWVLVAALVSACLLPPLPAREPNEWPATQNKLPDLEVPPNARTDGRLPPTVLPLRYELELDVDPRESRFSGRTTIEVSVARTTSVVVLHAGDFFVRSITAEVGSRVIGGQASRRAPNPDELVLRFERRLPVGTAKISIAYDAPFAKGDDPRGLFRRKEPFGWYAFTQFEPCGAREMFPSFDEPSFKVPFDVTVTVPAGMSVFGNMPEMGRALTSEGTRFQFATTPPLPTYLVAIAVGEFEVVEGPPAPVPIRLIRPAGKRGAAGPALEAAAALVPILADLLGHRFPFPKLDLVAVPGPFAGAMENAGLITFADKILLLEPGRASAWQERTLVEIVAHEIAHQWAGDLVTARWWDDIWLNEGFATFLAPRAIDRWRASFHARREQLAAIERMMDDDMPESQWPIRGPVFSVKDAERILHSGVEYEKGAAFLIMVERFVGQDEFWHGMQKYFRDNAWKSAGTDDFAAAIEAASAKSVTASASAFLERSGIPIVGVERTCKGDSLASIAVRQESLRFDVPQPAAGTAWAIPFCFSAGEASSDRCIEVKAEKIPLPLENGPANCRSWIDPNPGIAGYYRYEVTEEDLDLVRPVARRLTPEAKLGLLYNAWASVKRLRLKPAAVMRLLPAFDDEDDVEVIFAITRTLSLIHDLVGPDAQDSFDAYALARLRRHKIRLGLGAKKGRGPLRGRARGEGYEVTLARSTVLWGLLDAGDKDAVLRAKDAVVGWLNDPTKPVDPDIGTALFNAAARGADATLFERWVEQVEHPSAPGNRDLAVMALGRIDDPTLLRRAFDLSLQLDLEPNQIDVLFWTAAKRARRRSVVFDWIASNWKRIVAKWPGHDSWPIVHVARFACEDEESKAFEKLFSELPSSEQGQVKDYMRDAARCHDLLTHGRGSVEDYLRSFASTRAP